jgi:hypothetical protein
MTNRDVKPETYEPGVWYDWSGGENPVPGRMVEVRWRDNSRRCAPGSEEHSDGWEWHHSGSRTCSDIIAFRLVEADKGSSAEADTHRATDGAVVAVPRELVVFLLGEGEFDGHDFGDVVHGPGGRRLPYWWRKPLRQCLSPSVPTEGHGTGVVGWQPIETAPKDGTRILVFDDDGEVLPTRFARWTHPFTEDALAGFVTGWNSEFNVPESWCSPTHWMPLPPPPAASVSMGTSRKASEPIPPVEGVNAELLECLKTVRDYVSDVVSGHVAITKGIHTMALHDLARIDIAIATATRNSGDGG